MIDTASILVTEFLTRTVIIYVISVLIVALAWRFLDQNT